jgi:hypothetical protein
MPADHESGPIINDFPATFATIMVSGQLVHDILIPIVGAPHAPPTDEHAQSFRPGRGNQRGDASGASGGHPLDRLSSCVHFCLSFFVFDDSKPHAGFFAVHF